MRRNNRVGGCSWPKAMQLTGNGNRAAPEKGLQELSKPGPHLGE